MSAPVQGTRPAPPPAAAAASTTDLWVVTACCVVATVGLCGDIARHLEAGTSITGDFLASWHLVLYGGVTGLAIWLGRMAIVQGPATLRATFGPTVAGVFVLGAGGLADGIWHTLFGSEVEIAALVSPPHLLLLVGLVLVLLGPVAALWRGGGDRLGFSDAAVITVCTTCLTIVVMLFTGYLSLFASDVIVNGYANPMVGTRLSSTEVIHGIATMVWTSLVLTLPWVVLRLRWRPRPGMLAFTFLVLAATTAASVNGAAGEVVSGTLAAGVIIDVALAVLTPRWTADRGMLATAVAVPLVLWACVFAGLEASDRLWWGATLWVGAMALAMLATVSATGIVVLARRAGAAQAAAAGPGRQPA